MVEVDTYPMTFSLSLHTSPSLHLSSHLPNHPNPVHHMTTPQGNADPTRTIRVALSEIRLKASHNGQRSQVEAGAQRQSLGPALHDPTPGEKTQVAGSEWVLWPRGPLRQAECKCQIPKRRSHEAPILNGSDLIDYGVACFGRVWQKATGAQVPRVVAEAVLRVLHQLRQEGYEMLHIAAKDVRQDAKRTELSILFLVPSNDKANGWHRWVAEVLVHRYVSGRHPGKVENVATRFASDWTDWTISFPRQMYDDETDAEFVIDLQAGGSEITGRNVVRAIAEQASRGLGIQSEEILKGLKKRIATVTEWINRQEQHVCALVVKKRYIRSESGRSAHPCVTVSLYAQYQDGDEGEQLSGDDRAAGADDGKDHQVGRRFSSAGKTAAAVIVMEGQKDGQSTKPFMVIFHGEWPIAHQYRTRFPPPDLSSLGETAIAAANDPRLGGHQPR